MFVVDVSMSVRLKNVLLREFQLFLFLPQFHAALEKIQFEILNTVKYSGYIYIKSV